MTDHSLKSSFQYISIDYPTIFKGLIVRLNFFGFKRDVGRSTTARSEVFLWIFPTFVFLEKGEHFIARFFINGLAFPQFLLNCGS